MNERLRIRLDLWQLEIFCAVVELQSFSRAAEALFLSQPTVTSHITALEKRLGVRLLDRTTRKVKPTPAGEILYRHAKALLAEHEAILQELSRLQGGLMGWLVFGADTTSAHHLLPPIISEFRRQFPQTRLSMRIGSSSRVLNGVLNGELEMGVVGMTLDEPNLQFIPLWSDEIVLIVHPEHEWAERSFVPIEEVSTQPFVFREEGSGTRKIFEQFLAQNNFHPHRLTVVAEVGSAEAVKQFVSLGGGIGFVSIRTISDEERERLKIVRLQEGRITRQFYAVTPKERNNSPLCSLFVRFLKEQAG
ncbi:MAG: selenium metabolism-associated LysR family transcriptional regulator [Armatimonadetes bacterium]|nr:selenium metabolism-associated LysR family transcriptional regulator [Armatimonadota bacterium]